MDWKESIAPVASGSGQTSLSMDGLGGLADEIAFSLKNPIQISREQFNKNSPKPKPTPATLDSVVPVTGQSPQLRLGRSPRSEADQCG